MTDGTNPTPGPEVTISHSTCHVLLSMALATFGVSLLPVASQADIILSGVATINGPMTNGAGIVSPAAIGATITPDGFKVTGIDLSYTTPGGELGKNVTVSWIGASP